MWAGPKLASEDRQGALQIERPNLDDATPRSTMVCLFGSQVLVPQAEKLVVT